MVSLDIEDSRLEKRIEIWEKIIALKSILQDEYIPDLVFEDCHLLENGKEISRMYVQLDDVSVHNKNTWQHTMEFLYDNMDRLESFFYEYEDYLKP